MLTLLIGFASCYFIPFNISEIVSCPQITDESTLSDVVSKNPIVVALSCPSDDRFISYAFTNAEPLFPEAVFVIVDNEILKKYLKQKMPAEPSISVFKNGKFNVIVGPIYDQNTVLYVIDLYINEKREVLKTSTEIVAALGETPVTVITTSNDYSHTFSMTKKMLDKTGPINVLSISKEAADDIGLVKGKCLIYRTIDKVLETAQCNMRDIQSAMKSSYENAKVNLLKESTKPCVLLHTFQTNDENVKEFMYKLGSNFKDFNFFLVNDKEACDLVDKYYQNKFCHLTRLGIVDFKSHIAYNISTFIDTLELETDTFDYGKLVSNVSRLIYQVRNHAVPHFYMSEKIQNPSKSPLKRIVGLNYKEKIEENDTDVLVLYLKPKSSECSKAFTKFRSIADDALKCDDDDVNQTNTTKTCNKNINTHIRFYFIITGDNYVEGGFPTYPNEPAIFLFSALDKTKPRLVIGTEQADIQNHIRLFAKYPVNFTTEYPLGTMDHFEEQSKHSQSVRGRMTVEEVETLLDTIEKVSAEFKKSNNEQKSDEL